MIGRVAGTIAGWGREGGYFATDDDAQAFEDELTHILLNQMAAFNSPVWFNVASSDDPQCSARFVLDFIWCKAREEEKAAALRGLFASADLRSDTNKLKGTLLISASSPS
jgi:hypothetical protein